MGILTNVIQTKYSKVPLNTCSNVRMKNYYKKIVVTQLETYWHSPHPMHRSAATVSSATWDVIPTIWAFTFANDLILNPGQVHPHVDVLLYCCISIFWFCCCFCFCFYCCFVLVFLFCFCAVVLRYVLCLFTIEFVCSLAIYMRTNIRINMKKHQNTSISILL